MLPCVGAQDAIYLERVKELPDKDLAESIAYIMRVPSSNCCHDQIELCPMIKLDCVDDLSCVFEAVDDNSMKRIIGVLVQVGSS